MKFNIIHLYHTKYNPVYSLGPSLSCYVLAKLDLTLKASTSSQRDFKSNVNFSFKLYLIHLNLTYEMVIIGILSNFYKLSGSLSVPQTAARQKHLTPNSTFTCFRKSRGHQAMDKIKIGISL